MIWISESTFYASRSTVRSLWALWTSFEPLRDHHAVAVDLSVLDFILSKIVAASDQFRQS